MKSHRTLLFLFIITQVLGFAFLWSKLPDTSEQAMTPAQFADAVLTELDDLKNTQENTAIGAGTSAVSFPEAESFRSAIRAILKEELAAILQQRTVAASAAYASGAPSNAIVSQAGAQTTAQNEPPLTAEQEQRREESMATSRNILDQAITAGHWSVDDTTAMLPHVGDLSQAQRIELLEQFNKALGKGQIQLEGPPPPL